MSKLWIIINFLTATLKLGTQNDNLKLKLFERIVNVTEGKKLCNGWNSFGFQSSIDNI